jgi:hypothetical protein
MIRRRTIFALFGIAASAFAHADIALAPPTAAVQGKDQLLALIDAEYKPLNKKDEFETTAQFQQRQRQNVGREFLITVPALNKQLLGPKALAYDADTQTATITLRGDSFIEALKVFDIQNSDTGKVVSSSGLLNGRYTKFTLTAAGPTVEKEYDAQNAMGARVKIKTVKDTFSAVAFLNLPESMTQQTYPSTTFKMSPDDARQLFGRAQWQLVVRTAIAPGQKSLVLEDGSYKNPTVTDPYELYTVGKTITASMLRAELVDPQTGTILATFLPKGSAPESDKTGVKLGVKMTAIAPAMVTSLGLDSPNGVLVASVDPGSAAEKAGIKAGDILLRIGDTTIKGPADLQSAVAVLSPGSTAVIEVLREHAHSTINVQF